MKQLVLDLKSGQVQLPEVPAPAVSDGHLLVQTSCSVVSPGTEKMLVDFGRGGWLSKAKQQPERVQQVIRKIKTDGLRPTLGAVFNKLGQPLPLGYSQCGTVIAVGRGVTGFRVGDRVASNGFHAEVVSVPRQLAARVPDNVPDEAAAFTVLASIALQSIRLLNPTFGETVAVIGLGLIGQLTAQLLQANGCRVIGFDIDERRLKPGAFTTVNSNVNDPVAYGLAATGQLGVDGVIITASASDDAIVEQAAQMSRKRGRIILTGVADLQLKRSDFYEKELSFQVSCSYGPGRYEPAYEQQGLDYPIGFVRWTEQRNFQAVLQAVAAGQLDLTTLITQRVKLEDFEQVYGSMGRQDGASVLLYDLSRKHAQTIEGNHAAGSSHGRIGLIGAGNFATGVVLPALQQLGEAVAAIASGTGLSAAAAAKKFGIARVSTDQEAIMQDPGIDLLMIITRHEQHAPMVASALRSGKHVFVEKPLAIDEAGLQTVIDAYAASGRLLFVGFNRRFAPLAVQMKALITPSGGPLHLTMTINAGSIPLRHWLNQPGSGGRLEGEICHFIDLASFLCDASVSSVCTQQSPGDNASVLLRMSNGSTATIHYFTNGSTAYDKERIEAFSDGRVLILENWRRLRGYGFRSFHGKSGSQDKGHLAQFRSVLSAVRLGGGAPVSFASLVNTTRATLAIAESARQERWISIV